MKMLSSRFQKIFIDYKVSKNIIFFVIFGVILYLSCMLWLGWHDAVKAFTALGSKMLLGGAAISSLTFLWRFGRWHYIVNNLGYYIPRIKHLGIYLSGLALTATPGKVGETYRSAFLLRYDVKFSDSIAAFIVDRGSDVLGMILLGTLSAMFIGDRYAWAWMLCFIALFFGSRVLLNVFSTSMGSPVWDKISPSIKWFSIKNGQETIYALAKLWSLKKVIFFSFIAMFSYGAQALIFAWFSHALRVEISTFECIFIFVQATLFGAASMVPGGLGAMEVALVYQLVDKGVSYANATSLAISIRLVTLWFGMIVGVISLWLLSKK